MELQITLGERNRVEAHTRLHRVVTDQDGSAPGPFELFLASIGTCTGFYVSRFCRQRGIPTRDIRIHQRSVEDREGRHVERIELVIQLPDDFPEKYRDAVLRAAGMCTVKRHLEHPPAIEITATRQIPEIPAEARETHR